MPNSATRSWVELSQHFVIARDDDLSQYIRRTGTRLKFGRGLLALRIHRALPLCVIVSPHKSRASGWSARLARVIRDVLLGGHLDGIVVLEGPISATVCIPFPDGPAYEVLRARLHGIAGDVVAADPAIDITKFECGRPTGLRAVLAHRSRRTDRPRRCFATPPKCSRIYAAPRGRIKSGQVLN